MRVKIYVYFLLFFSAIAIASENKSFDPLEEEVIVQADTGLSSFEDNIIQKLIMLGAFYNKQATFLAVAFGVVIAIFFPQQTKSFVRTSASCVMSSIVKIRNKFLSFTQKEVIATAYDSRNDSSV